jgi:hypothetical protein
LLPNGPIRQIAGRSLIKGLRPPVRLRYASRSRLRARRVWQYRGAATSSGALAASVRFHAAGCPQLSRPLHRPRAGITAGTGSSIPPANTPFITAPRGAPHLQGDAPELGLRARHHAFSLQKDVQVVSPPLASSALERSGLVESSRCSGGGPTLSPRMNALSGSS